VETVLASSKKPLKAIFSFSHHLTIQPSTMASQEMRFSLNERTPGAIKSQGGVSGTSVNVEDLSSVQSIVDTIHNAKAENHDGTTDWYVLIYHNE
jgi:hypothetical protein